MEEYSMQRKKTRSDTTESALESISTQDVVDHVWPEDPRQLKFKFMQRAESLVREMLNDDLMVMIDSPVAHRIVDSLLEDEGPHSHSCVMINLPEELANQIIAWGRLQVNDEDVTVDEKGGKGREMEPHITVLYGLLDSKPSPMLEQVFEHTAPFDIKLGPCSLFKNGEHDVLKMDVISPFLRALNRNICSVVTYENDFPDYKPHVTIAYVRPGTCDRLEGASPWDDPVKLGVTKLGQEGVFQANEVVFSSLDGQVTKHPLGPANAIGETFSADRSWQSNLYDLEIGRQPLNGGELMDWLVSKAGEYHASTGRPYDRQLASSRADFRSWLENRLAVQAVIPDWEAGMFESVFNRPPVQDGELAKWIREASQAHYQETKQIAGLREWLVEALGDPTEDEYEEFIRGSGVAIPKREASGRTIRRIIGGHRIDKVEIWKIEKDARRPGYPWPPEAKIRITYFDNGRHDSPRQFWEDEWSCFSVLKWSLRNWRNLYGARLFVNDVESGTVGYRNPALGEHDYVERAV